MKNLSVNEITANRNISNKWNIPNKISKSTAIKSPPNFLSKNFYQPLFNSKTAHHDDKTNNKQGNNSDKKLDTTTLDGANHFKFNSLVINLSNRTITETEKTVLELGLTFCPSQKNFNKKRLSLDFFKFIRGLKLREYFHSAPSNSDNNNDISKDERSESKWKTDKSKWYPDEVKNNRSEGLTKFIDDVTKDLKTQIKKNENKFWNNLSDNQRKALIHLSNDKSITIKLADKGGAIVIMDTEKYEMECLKTLSDPNFYEELPSDPNPEYRGTIDGTIDDLLSEEIITDFEAEQMKEGTRTPSFYGLPKIHRDFDSFLPLRPICSGFNSCTVKISEFVDVFLKPAAQQNPTESFIHQRHFPLCSQNRNDVAEKTTPNKTFLVTNDVSSLYPNIDHNEGISACGEVLSQRDYRLVPTSVLSNVIRLILQCNTLKFGEIFFSSD